MACNRHKQKEHGKVVPVYRGIAGDMKRVVDGLHSLESVTFGEVRKYRGNKKIRFRWGRNEDDKRVLRIEICDPDFGEGVMRLRTPHPGAIARVLHKAMENNRQLSSCRER